MAVTEEGTDAVMEPVVDPAMDPLERAVAVARREEPSGWSVVAADVMRRARAIRRSDEPVLADVRDDGSRTVVSTRVLLELLRRALTGDAAYAPEDVTFLVEDERLVGVRVAVVAAYGADLLAAAASVRSTVVAEVTALVPLTVATGTAVVVDVDVVDVVEGDPRRT